MEAIWDSHPWPQTEVFLVPGLGKERFALFHLRFYDVEERLTRNYLRAQHLNCSVHLFENKQTKTQSIENEETIQ